MYMTKEQAHPDLPFRVRSETPATYYVYGQPEPFPVPTKHLRHGRAHWGSIPVYTIKGNRESILRHLPVFERLDTSRFGLASNPHYDLVVRQPRWSDEQPTPIGLVSKTYQLIQHATVLHVAHEHLKRLVKKDGEFLVSAEMTDTCERVMFRFDLGPDFAVSPDGKPVSLHLLVWNSVDGSTAIRAQLDWYRLICSNGLVAGVTLGRTRVTHSRDAYLASVFEPLSGELTAANAEGKTLCDWAGRKVSMETLATWIDATVEIEWGVLAAARVWEICQSGHDGEFVPPFESVPARRRRLRLTKLVPGSIAPARNVYAVAQALSWVASRKNDLDERMARQNSIGTLIRPLLRNGVTA
jgi:hypothetical protein